MVIVWWSDDLLTHYSFLNPSETMTSERYAHEIDEMHQKLQHLQLVLVNRIGPILIHNNTLLQLSSTTMPYLTTHNQYFKS